MKILGMQMFPKPMADDEILASVENFTASGELYALFFMMMHMFDLQRLLYVVRMVRNHISN